MSWFEQISHYCVDLREASMRPLISTSDKSKELLLLADGDIDLVREAIWAAANGDPRRGANLDAVVNYILDRKKERRRNEREMVAA